MWQPVNKKGEHIRGHSSVDIINNITDVITWIVVITVISCQIRVILTALKES